ncbi:hypothetical protein [Pseudopedobacter beijingensis]|uniref:Positive regulator of sigma(E), RseC/MucC n=1 Tax=Pseudopedobacter beijingensis TaxID=1207056 RepID=A0ABW4ICV1_9SPHI
MIDKNILATKVIESGGKLSVKSALNPILWLCAIISIPSLVIAVWGFNEPPTWLIGLIIGPVFIALLGFLFLLFFDRDKLQSEEYQLKKRSLELIQEKGQSEPNLIDTQFDDLDLTENNEFIQIKENKNKQ